MKYALWLRNSPVRPGEEDSADAEAYKPFGPRSFIVPLSADAGAGRSFGCNRPPKTRPGSAFESSGVQRPATTLPASAAQNSLRACPRRLAGSIEAS